MNHTVNDGVSKKLWGAAIMLPRPRLERFFTNCAQHVGLGRSACLLHLDEEISRPLLGQRGAGLVKERGQRLVG